MSFWSQPTFIELVIENKTKPTPFIFTSCFSGLQLVIDIHQEEYMLNRGDVAGIKVVVHDQHTMPFPVDEGVTITPGRATTVAVSKV